MYLPIVVTLLGVWTIGGQTSDFTINSIELKALPSTGLKNGEALELQCVVKVAKTTDFVLNSTISFYMDDKKIYTNSTTEDQVSYIIPKVRVSHTGQYKCDVSVAGRIKTSEDVKIRVTGLSPPLIHVPKDPVSEGDDVTVRCEAPEEWSYKLFTFYKINKNQREEKQKSTDTNYQEVRFMIKEGEEILQFQCDVRLVLLSENSPPSKMETVPVVAPFSVPRIEVLPSLNFTEGNNMSVKCSFQEGRKRSQDMKLTLQKDGHIINSSTTNTLSYFRVATVDDMGNYTCKVESKRTSKSNSTKIDIAELFPRPVLALERNRQNEYIKQSDYIVLKCSVAGLSFEESARLKYKFLVNGGKRTFTRGGGRLEMTAEERYSGSYVCQVTISNITKISEPLEIQVYAPVINPVLTHIMRSNKSVVLGDPLELTCRCESGTPPIMYSLLLGNDVLETKTVYGHMGARFLVNSSRSHDHGQFRCRAINRNTGNSTMYSNTVNVTVIIPISSVNLIIIQPNGDIEEGAELSLICQAENGTLPITFLFYRKKGSEILLRNVTEAKQLHASHQVHPFSKNEDGAYFCVASNRALKEVRSGFADARAVLATWKKAVIGTFVLLIVLAAIAICAYMHTDKKKKGKDISSAKSRSSKPVTTTKEKPAVEMKAGEPHYGKVENEYELHILKTAEESPGNNQQNHQEDQTEGDGASPDADPDAAENNVNTTEEAPEANNHP
ncbi:platelet endothelial cell adhesion molecule isoform X2 [Bufo bufo]|uniref:platelet endothelial cell adhesion molecule isoform X2 n=1 Tax=Bufo bufo TaxID=8384 RepID=UPI001ABDAAB6|nr:platelet endothelial cell adhesion molecule isoform X2 [Bufo bufo]